ncbi:YtxH domain-containing protein [Ornithinimicrobium kibberense]|uniref:YtxH domain-containing protein n=1 Tax=Ornithinimicrobium kibberense TaxID=282060 RepID=A0ABV5V0Q8_9MICO|nr:YtxH domain-containing protein [Ornithinimicrobium kibberense]
MNKLLLLVGAGVGYVLGARAGRERYDQIADQANKLWTDPRVQTKVEEVKEKAPEVAQKVSEQAKSKAGEARSKIGGHESTASDGSYSNATGSYDPNTGVDVDSTQFGPGGDKLP